MDTGLGLHLMAYWANWKLSAGGQPLAQLMVVADARAIAWLLARHSADIVGSAAATITMGAAAGLALHRFRARRWPPGPTDRTSSPD
jgi:hypothetical protein